MTELLRQGSITLPNYQGFYEAIGADATTADAMFRAMWHNYLKDKGSISLPYWADRFSSRDSLNLVLKSLSLAGWIESHAIPARNWAEALLRETKLLEYLSQDELDSIRAHHKFSKYKLDRSTASIDNKVRINGSVKHTGLQRTGFMQASNVQYRYDTATLAEYREAVQLNLIKSMDKIKEIYDDFHSDRATYDTISCELLDYYLTADLTMSNGQNSLDSRGRNIHGCLDKVGNYVSCKDMRASLIIV